MSIKSRANKNILDYKEKMSRDAAIIEEKWRKLSDGDDAEVTYASRFEVPCPEPKDQSKYNSSGIVDIETFISHPHFLGLTPFPWQILILKLFYLGTPGNMNLEISQVKKEEVSGCVGCVWEKFKKNEEDCVLKQRKQEPVIIPLLNAENSMCLTCNRLDPEIRTERYEYEIHNANDFSKERTLINRYEDDTEDRFECEHDLINDIEDEAVRLQTFKKIRNDFQELVLILGRRSGKSFITSVIALYELYKLLKIPHPQKKLGQPDFQEIFILNVAKNETQAKDSIFTPMKNYAMSSPFFQRYLDEPLTLEITFFTENDLKENERREARGMPPLSGTLILKCGSSSASGLVGKTCWCIILDELAAMAGDNPESALDKKLYDDLKPSLATFGKYGKIISLSNPKGPIGMLFTLYNTRIEESDTLIIKLPTWKVNANIDKVWLEGQRRKDPVEYNMQYGAEFGNNSANPFLSVEDVEYAFDFSTQITRNEKKEYGIDYYCHVDPANRSDYYCISVVHGVPTGERDMMGKPIKKFFVDHIQFWAPIQMKQPVDTEEVRNYLIYLHQNFSFRQISFDQWHSMEMIESLKKLGFPVVLKVFNKEYKDKIYSNILEVFRQRRIEFYKISSGTVLNNKQKLIEINEIPEAKDQFTFLQKKWVNGRQVIGALPGYKDDICDSVAAAVYEAQNNNTILAKLPKPRAIYTGLR